MKLYTYFRSTAAYRVRIALHFKGLEHELVPVHLLRNGGEHRSAEYLAKNPNGLVPALDTEGAEGAEGETLAQSLAILEYLEEAYPENPILPSSPLDRAYVRGIAQTIACDIHPVNNLRVLKYLTGELGVSDEQKSAWYQHWVAVGFQALETRLSSSERTGDFCFGDQPTMADMCLVPQVFNAERFNCPMNDYPTIQHINEHCLTLDVFKNAAPGVQPDAE